MERWIKDDLGILQFDLHFEEWKHLMLRDDQRIQNLTKMLQGDRDRRHKAFNDNVVDLSTVSF